MEDPFPLAEVLATLAVSPGLIGAWYAAGLRGELNRKWSQRVDVAHAGLAVRANAQLRALQAELADRLGFDQEGDFDPLSISVDPAPLVRLAGEAAETLKERELLRGRFRRHLALGTLFLWAALGYLAACACVAVGHFADMQWAVVTGIVGLVCAVVFGAMLFGCYALHEHWLASAEIHGGGAE